MKLGPVTKLGKRNKITSKRFDDDVMSKNRHFTAICPIYSQFGARNAGFSQKMLTSAKLREPWY